MVIIRQQEGLLLSSSIRHRLLAMPTARCANALHLLPDGIVNSLAVHLHPATLRVESSAAFLISIVGIVQNQVSDCE
jgi:hypothetical protein